MRICFVSRRYFPAISGMSVYAQNLLRELVGAGHDVTMVSQYRGDAFGTKVYGGGLPPAVPGVRVIGLEQRGEQESGDFERDIATMVETIVAEHQKKPFDVLHAQYGYPTGFATLIASQRLGVPNVVSIQGGDGHWVGSCCETHRLAMVRVLAHANALLIGGRSFVAEVCDRLGSDPDRFTIVPGAVDTTRFRPPEGWQPGDAADPVRLFYHGRVDRRKGVLDFLDALSLLRLRGTPFSAIISGIGPDVEPARDLAADLGFPESQVRFTGYAEYDAVPDLYAMGDVFVSPTYAEGSPTPSWKPWRRGRRWSRPIPSASPTACATARTGCWSSPATCRLWPRPCIGSSPTAAYAPAWRRRPWRSAGGSIPGRRWGGRSWTSMRR